jgi:tetrathionate reductase subunit B
MWEQQRPQWIRKVKLRDLQTGVVTNLPLMCQHCEHPPCVDVCPTGASFKRVDGIVMVDRHICIGCRYCMMACPYKARSFIHQDVAEQVVKAPRGKGCVESCNLCAHRIDAGENTTACAEACAKEGHHAILFGDLKDPNSPLSQALKSVNSRADSRRSATQHRRSLHQRLTPTETNGNRNEGAARGAAPFAEPVRCPRQCWPGTPRQS